MGQFSAGETIVRTRKTSLPARLLVYFLNLILVWLFISALLPYFPTPFLRGEMIFSYPPRFVYFFPALLLSFYFGRRRAFVRLFVSTLTLLLLFFKIGLGGGPQEAAGRVYTVLAFNVHDAASSVQELKKISEGKNVDILMLQEVKEENRAVFVQALEDYVFFAEDKARAFKYAHTWPFTSLTGIRKTLLGDDVPFVETAITDYRTFAVRAVLEGKPIWVVNVHFLKPFSNQDGLYGYTGKVPHQAARHVSEGALLKGWLLQHQEDPVLIAGDFNAPYYAPVMQLPGISNAHLKAGRGLHRTFPAYFPVWGIDHMLMNGFLKPVSYEVFDAGFSDHLAQLGRFEFETQGAVNENHIP